MNLHRQGLSDIRYNLIFMLLAGKPDWFRHLTEQVNYGRATQLKSRSIDEAPEWRYVSQVNTYIKRGQETCAGRLIQSFEVKE
jgi:hypothetical protein